MSSTGSPAQVPTFAVAFGTLRHCFDQAWQAIGDAFAGDEADAARIRLAAIMLDLAHDGRLSPDQITQSAIRQMRNH